MKGIGLWNKSNVHGVKNVWSGIFKGKKCLFTHRNPVTGDVWSDDIPVGKEFGAWVPFDSVDWDTRAVRNG